MLVNVHLRTEKVSQVDQKLYMWNNFLVKCKEILKSNADRRAKANIIKAIKKLIQGLEGKKYQSGNEPSKITTKFTA